MTRDSVEEQALLPAQSNFEAGNTWRKSRWLLYGVLIATNICSGLLAFQLGHLEARRVLSMDPVGIEAVYGGVSRGLVDYKFAQFDLYNNRSRYTATPSIEVDDAWDEIGAGRHAFLLPLKYGSLFGLDPRRYLNVRPPQWGVDKTGYVVQLWAAHDVHCVNQLRMSLYYNHDYYKSHGAHQNETEAEHRAHINHCVDILRERVMCTADAGVIPTAWGPGEFDFGTTRKCYNQRSLLDWLREHEINRNDPLVGWDRIKIPSDAIFGAAGYTLGQ